MKKKNIFLLFGLVIFVSVFFMWNYVYQDHRNIAKESAEYNIKATELSSEFINNVEKASKKYLNKVLLISGDISEISSEGIVLDNSVFLQLSENDSTHARLQNGLKFKGRCIGFDDLLELVKIDQCSVQTN